LHGNSKKKETALDGSKDENIFDIQQGIAISLFTRNLEESKSETVNILHSSLLGLRNDKYEWLVERDINTSQPNKLQPNSPFYMFVPRDESFRGEYEQCWKITDIMSVNSTGIVTARDHFVVDFDRGRLIERISEFANSAMSDIEIREKYFKDKGSVKYPNGDTRGWKLPNARKKVQTDRDWDKRAIKCLYRPFDDRFLYYTDWMVDWGRSDVMCNMLAGENLGFHICKQIVSNDWQHILATTNITDDCYVSNKTRERGYTFPLYIYPTTQAELDMDMTRHPNLSSEFLTKIERNLGYQPTPEAIFYYIYAIFHSPTYRSRYAEFLKIDFPRVPLTSDDKLFKQLATLGEKLVNLHLMKSIQTGRGGDWDSELGGNSSAEVGAGYPKYESGKVTINKQGEGFINVPEAVWKFHVGGYQVCHKWLKDRKGRVLSAEDIAHYQGIVAALGETIEVMQQIDKAIPGFPIQ
jgi:predicted helicase